MNIPKLEIKILEEQLTKSILSTDLNFIPIPCALYINSSNNLYINAYTAELLGMDNTDDFDIKEIMTLNPNLQSLLHKYDTPSAISFQRIKVKLNNGTQISINIRAQLIVDKDGNEVYFIFLSKSSKMPVKAHPIFSLLLVRNEIALLRNHLDETGIAKLDSIMETYFSKKDKPLMLEDMIVYEEELQVLQRKFPILSNRELLICVLLLNNLDFKEIAILTNRTLNSVSVGIHRINRKLNFASKNELILRLKETIEGG